MHGRSHRTNSVSTMSMNGLHLPSERYAELRQADSFVRVCKRHEPEPCSPIREKYLLQCIENSSWAYILVLFDGGGHTLYSWEFYHECVLVALCRGYLDTLDVVHTEILFRLDPTNDNGNDGNNGEYHSRWPQVINAFLLKVSLFPEYADRDHRWLMCQISTVSQAMFQRWSPENYAAKNETDLSRREAEPRVHTPCYQTSSLIALYEMTNDANEVETIAQPLGWYFDLLDHLSAMW